MLFRPEKSDFFEIFNSFVIKDLGEFHKTERRVYTILINISDTF